MRGKEKEGVWKERSGIITYTRYIAKKIHLLCFATELGRNHQSQPFSADDAL